MGKEGIKKYQELPEETQKPFLWTRLIQSVTTMDIISPVEDSIQTNLIIDDESKGLSDKRHVDYDAMELTTIVKQIRRRNERNTQPMNGRLKKLNKSITNKRLKRSILTDNYKNNGNSTDATKESTPSMGTLHRHPKLTYEDQKNRTISKEFVDTTKENNTNVNEFTDFYKRIWDIINGTRPRFKIVVPSIKEPTRSQPVTLKDEYTASASEVEDLNLPYTKIEKKKSLEEVPFDDRRPSQEDELGKYVKAEVEGIEDSSTLIPLEKLENRYPDYDSSVDYRSDKDYSNIYKPDEDYSSTYKSDKDYSNISDPDKNYSNIPKSDKNYSNASKPYKDCSKNYKSDKDYSNISDPDKNYSNIPKSDKNYSNTYKLDKNCNYPSSGTINDDQVADSPEEIDSSVENLNLTYNQTGSLNVNKKSSPIREPLHSESEDVKEHSTLLSKNKQPVEEYQEIYDPDKIPYVEVPDYEDEREKSLDEEDRRQAKQENVKSLNRTYSSSDYVEATKAPDLTNSKRGRKDESSNADIEIINENNEKKLESPDKLKDNLNNTKKSKDEKEEIQSGEEEESDISILPFDINEYRKPFNLHDFLKNEPFFAKFKNNKDYVRESSDRDEVTESDNYSSKFKDNVSTGFADADEQDPRYERVTQDRSNHDIHEEGSEEIINEDLYRYGDKDFFKRLFEENRKKRENFEMSAEEKDFLDRYFTKDVIKKLGEDSVKETPSETKKNEMAKKYKNKKDALKALSSILAKKDHISRLDEEVNKEIEDGKSTPSFYKNYWSLEYVLPGKNDENSNENKTANM